MPFELEKSVFKSSYRYMYFIYSMLEKHDRHWDDVSAAAFTSTMRLCWDRCISAKHIIIP